MTIEAIREELQKISDIEPPFHEFAVLIPIFELEGSLHVLFEVRSATLASQPGEVCLPGGRLEPEEALDETALRETCEELGICKDAVELLGPVAPQITPFRYALHPFVGYLRNFSYPEDIHPNPAEVADFFCVPLTWFLENPPMAYSIKSQFDFPEDFPYHLIQNGRQYAWKSADYPVLFYCYGDRIIWGMTAKIIRDFCQRITPKT